MNHFDPLLLRALRTSMNVTAAELAGRMGISPPQIHRLEKGDRRLTVNSLLEYCEALGVSAGQLFTPNSRVPVTGVIDSDFEIQPIPQNSDNTTLAPPLVDDMSQVAAVRWAASKFAAMSDHLVFFRRHNDGIPEEAWNKRGVIIRRDGSQCLGWPIRQGKEVHIDVGSGPTEFNVDIVWASPVLAVMPPFAIERLQPPPERI